MKFGAMNFPATPVLQEIDTFARLGFDYLELTMDPPMAHYSTLSSNQTAITTMLKDSGLGLICHLPTFVTTADLTDSLRRASVTEMRRSLSVAADLGAEKVVLHPCMVIGMGRFVIDTVKSYANEFLFEMDTASKSLGVTICLENMMPRNILGVEPDDLDTIFKTFPAFNFTLDTGHANIDDNGGNRLGRLVERFGTQIGHLHFSDNLGEQDDHLPVGRGNINFSDLISSIKTTGYNETLTVEVFDEDRQVLADSREKIEALFSAPPLNPQSA